MSVTTTSRRSGRRNSVIAFASFLFAHLELRWRRRRVLLALKLLDGSRAGQADHARSRHARRAPLRPRATESRCAIAQRPDRRCRSRACSPTASLRPTRSDAPRFRLDAAHRVDARPGGELHLAACRSSRLQPFFLSGRRYSGEVGLSMRASVSASAARNASIPSSTSTSLRSLRASSTTRTSKSRREDLGEPRRRRTAGVVVVERQGDALRFDLVSSAS